MIAIDQYGQIEHIAGKHPRQELLEKTGYKKADKMYIGNGIHIGYVIGRRWFTLYNRVEK